MITKGTAEYKKASQLANEIADAASKERRNNNSVFEMYFEKVGRFVMGIQKVGGFASQVAETIDKTMNPYGFKVANVSSKQAWILACAAIENGIEF